MTDWEELYQKKETPWDKGEASPGLVDFLKTFPGLPKGSVMVPGCGAGHDVREWARAGFDATGYDIAPSAVKLSKEKSAESGVVADFVLGDFLRDEPHKQFDWVFEHTCYCAIQPAEREDYLRAVLRWLKPGGQYLAVNYLIPDIQGPPFGTTRAEVVERFSREFELYQEWVPRSYPNRAWMEIMMWWRRRS
jgi:SAM-dependent methyltransferase